MKDDNLILSYLILSYLILYYLIFDIDGRCCIDIVVTDIISYKYLSHKIFSL